MSMSAVPSSPVMRSSWSRIVRCTVTSSALVGSSAISSFGLHARPIAMSARWRMPPENSCGYCLARSAASGRPAAASVSTTLRSTSLRVASPWASSVSATCVPILATGFRFDIGSCGTSPIDAPRMPRITLSGAPTRSSPSKRMLPLVTLPLPGSSPMTAIAVVDLPEPDSPTIASVSPAARSRSTPSTAWTVPSTVRNSTATSRTCSSGVPATTRSEDRGMGPSCLARVPRRIRRARAFTQS